MVDVHVCEAELLVVVLCALKLLHLKERIDIGRVQVLKGRHRFNNESDVIVNCTCTKLLPEASSRINVAGIWPSITCREVGEKRNSVNAVRMIRPSGRPIKSLGAWCSQWPTTHCRQSETATWQAARIDSISHLMVIKLPTCSYTWRNRPSTVVKEPPSVDGVACRSNSGMLSEHADDWGGHAS